MILSDSVEKRSDITYPCKGPPFFQVIGVMIIIECFNFEGIVPISNVVTLPVYPSNKVEQCIEYPVKDKQGFNLLPEMDLFMADQSGLIVRCARNPDEDKK